MAELDFPNSPVLDEVFDKWQWNGAAWTLLGVEGSDWFDPNPPGAPFIGQRWIDTETGSEYWWTGDEWVELGTSRFVEADIYAPGYQTTASGNGTTNDLPQLQADLAAAIASGRDLYIGPGTYRCVASTNSFFDITAPIKVIGAGAKDTVILLETPTADYALGFAVRTGGHIEGLTIKRNSEYASVMFQTYTGVSGFTTKDCVFDGNNITFPTNYSHGVSLPGAGVVDNLHSENCTWTHMGYPILNNNSSTLSLTTVRYTGCQFLDNSGEAFGLNFPNGTVRDVFVSGCTIKGAMTFLGLSIAHVNGMVATGNYIDIAGEAVHIEDYSTGVIISGNVFNECGKTKGTGAVTIIDSQRCVISDNEFTNTNLIFGIATQLLVSGGASGNTAGGRPRLNATQEISITGNTFSAGPNTAIFVSTCLGSIISNNTLRGGLAVSTGFVETGTQVNAAMQLGSGTNMIVADNHVKGFRYGIGWAASSASRSFANGTTISGNVISECRVGLLGRSVWTSTYTGNTIRQCIHPMVVGPHGHGANGGGCDPYVITGNTFTANKYRASIDGVHVIVAAGTGAIGTGVTLTVEPLLLQAQSGQKLTFPGGGLFTLTASAYQDATTITGNLTLAAVAVGEAGKTAGGYDRPNVAPWNVNNRTIGLNSDSVAGIPVDKVDLYPEDFGAVGDGVTDDTAALQAALSVAVSKRRRLIISRRHLISGTLNVSFSQGWAVVGITNAAAIEMKTNNTRIFAINDSGTADWRIEGLELSWTTPQTGNTNSIAIAFDNLGPNPDSWGHWGFVVTRMRFSKGYLAFGQLSTALTNPVWGCELSDWNVAPDWTGPVIVNSNTSGGSPNVKVDRMYIRGDAMGLSIPFTFMNCMGLTISNIEINNATRQRAMTINTCFEFVVKNFRTEKGTLLAASNNQEGVIAVQNSIGSIDGCESMGRTYDVGAGGFVYGVRVTNTSKVVVNGIRMVTPTYTTGTSNGLSVTTDSTVFVTTPPDGFSLPYAFGVQPLVSGADVVLGRLLAGAGITIGGGTVSITSGSGTPEAVVTAPVGSLFLRSDGAANTTLYIKQTGSGNTGWFAVTP